MTASASVRPATGIADPDNPDHVIAPNADGSVCMAEGVSAAYNVTAATVIKLGVGRSYKVSVIVAGSASGTLNDCATTGDASSANQVGTIPTTVNTYDFNWPHATGIVLVPGTGQTLAISYT